RGSVVSADHLAGFLHRSVPLDEQVTVARWDGNLRETGRRGRTRSKIGRERHLRGIVRVNIFPRCSRRTVRFGEGGGEEERLVLVFLHQLYGPNRCLVICVRFPGSIEYHDPVGLRSDLATGGTLCASEVARLARDAPGIGIVNAAVKNLAHSQGCVSVSLEVLRQSGESGVLRPKPRDVIHHAGGGWMAAGQQRGARGVAQRVLAIGALEAHTPLSQLIYVPRFDD